MHECIYIFLNRSMAQKRESIKVDPTELSPITIQFARISTDKTTLSSFHRKQIFIKTCVGTHIFVLCTTYKFYVMYVFVSMSQAKIN